MRATSTLTQGVGIVAGQKEEHTAVHLKLLRKSSTALGEFNAYWLTDRLWL